MPWIPTATGGGGSTAFSGARVTKATPGTLPTSEAAASFDTETFDTDGYHESVTNPERLTAPDTAYYLVTAGLDAGVSGTNRWFYMYVQKNGAGTESPLARIFSNITGMGSFLAIPVQLDATEYVTLRLNASHAETINRIFFAIHKVGT